MDNYDIFKIVEEVEKQRTMNIDDIFSTLDSVKDGVETAETVRPQSSKISTSTTSLIKKPSMPQEIGAFDTRFEAFKGIVEHVEYGSNSVNEYINGHKDALQKYYQDAYTNSKDLYVTEARVNDEINKYSSRSHLYEKGYYDGMFYILKALKRSKELLMERLNREISTKL